MSISFPTEGEIQQRRGFPQGVGRSRERERENKREKLSISAPLEFGRAWT